MKPNRARGRKHIKFWVFVICLVLDLANTQNLPAAQTSSDATKYDASIATDWFFFSLKLVQETPGYSPPVASRAFGYMGVTLYESVVPGMQGYQSLVGQLNGLVSLPEPEQSQIYDWSICANSALSEIVKKLFPYLSQANKITLQQLEQRLSSNANPEVIARSKTFGQAVATAIYNWSLQDNSEQQVVYLASSDSGAWQPTAPNFANALLPQWGQNRPLALSSGKECPISTPVTYSESTDSDFYKEALEVYQTSQMLTEEKRNIALFWSDDPGKTATPPGHWISVLTHLINVKNESLGHAAEAYAKLGIALADAFIACWDAKYTYNLLRPITYIQNHFDAKWQPLLNTPPFPEYPSGHSVQSAAAAVVLTDIFGEGFAFTDHTHDHHGMQARSFMSFWEAAEEAAISRLYGGIHFRAAIDNGLNEGKCIGEKTLELEFRSPEFQATQP